MLSTKENAGKWFFYVPEEFWLEVRGLSHAATGAGFEVLWGRQGVLCGAYKDKGEYTTYGDFNAIPEAPEWLLEMMRQSYRDNVANAVDSSLIKTKYSTRSKEERMVIAQSCLSVIPQQGRGSEDMWWRLGAAIHSELPEEEGLDIWREWSKLDPEYSNDWEHGDPCAARWANFKANKGIGFGTLVKIADKFDPERKRFHRDGCFQIVQAVEAESVQYKQARPDYEELINRAVAICNTDDVPRMNYELHLLSQEAGYKDQSGLESLLIDYMTQNEGGEGYDMLERKAVKREYIIPGLISKPFTYLFYGREGSGKSATAIALIKHIVDNIPFKLRNARVPVEQGKCIYFSADMSESDWEEEYELHEIKNEGAVRFEPNFSLYKKMGFIKTMKKYKPSLIVIDSLSSASGSKASDENKAEFAQPLYWLNTNNGKLWPACAIIVLHHANKSGGARGSTAIGAAVAEVWHIAAPDPEDKKTTLTTDQRLITVLKSRMGRTGEQLIQTQNEDLTLSITEMPIDEKRQTRAGSLTDRLLTRLRLAGSKWVSGAELIADKIIAGNPAAIRKALRRLENRGLIETMEGKAGTHGGKRPRLYRIISSHGETNEVSYSEEKHCKDRHSQCDTGSSEEKVSHWGSKVKIPNATTPSPEEECRIETTSAGASSDPNTPFDGYIGDDLDKEWSMIDAD